MTFQNARLSDLCDIGKQSTTVGACLLTTVFWQLFGACVTLCGLSPLKFFVTNRVQAEADISNLVVYNYYSQPFEKNFVYILHSAYQIIDYIDLFCGSFWVRLHIQVPQYIGLFSGTVLKLPKCFESTFTKYTYLIPNLTRMWQLITTSTWIYSLRH